MTTVTINNRGPLLNVGMWITLIAMCIAAGSKIYTKWKMIKTLQFDDLLMILAAATAIGQCIATSEQVQYGMGQHQESLTQTQLNLFYLAQYVAQILYLVTVFAAKLISLFFFIRLTRPSLRRHVVTATISSMVLWIVIGVFVVSFQCHLPQPWLSTSGSCINQFAFWTFNSVIDIVTQTIVGFFPVYLLDGLNSTKTKLRVAMLSFSPNVLTIPLIIVRIVYYFNISDTSDYTWNSFNLALVTNLHASLSVIVASISFSKPIIDSLVIAPHIITDDTRGHVITLKRPDFSGSNSSSFKPRGRRHFHRASSIEWPQRSNMGNCAAATSTMHAGDELQELEINDGSQENGIISQTRETIVTSSLRDDE